MLSALSRHSQAIATLRCSFPEADIGNGAQHFGGADDCNADKVSFRCGCTKVRFGEALNRLSFSFGCLGATKLAKQKCNIDHNLAGAHPSIQLYVKSVLNVLVAVQCAKAECDRADRESLNSFRQKLRRYVLPEGATFKFLDQDTVISVYGFGDFSDLLDSKCP